MDTTGYWECPKCGPGVDINCDREQNCCAICGCLEIKFHHPQEVAPSTRPSPKASARMSQERAKILFESLRKSL